MLLLRRLTLLPELSSPHMVAGDSGFLSREGENALSNPRLNDVCINNAVAYNIFRYRFFFPNCSYDLGYAESDSRLLCPPLVARARSPPKCITANVQAKDEAGDDEESKEESGRITSTIAFRNSWDPAPFELEA